MELMFEFLLIIFGIFLIGNGMAEGLLAFVWNTAVFFANIIVYGIGILFLIALLGFIF